MGKTKNLQLGKPAAFQVMIKPIGPICNLNCSYCYYLEKEKLYSQTNQWKISEDVLEQFIKQNIETHEVPVVQFVWQGGEPTLLGTDYFKKALEFQQKHAGKKRIENVFQTNGTLINEEWCKFFKRHDFLVGVSIDGPKELHDRYRQYKNGEPTWDRVVKSIEMLKDYGVEFNTLSVVHHENSRYPLEVYHFLKELGSKYMQFLPVVEQIGEDVNEDDLHLVSPSYTGNTRIAPWSVEPEDLGYFLTRIFDEWVRHDVGTYYVQHFDMALANWVGEMPGLCIFSKTCGEGPCLEHNGDLYTCDHYVYPEHRLGNVMKDHLKTLARSEQMTRFGRAKLEQLPNQCIECKYRFACNGGCPKNRISYTSDGEAGLNYLCQGYYRFFRHIHPYMQYMAELLEKKQPPANVMEWVRKMDFQQAIRSSGSGSNPQKPSSSRRTAPKAKSLKKKKPGRNEPCPCGSGKKYKNCCKDRVN